MKGIKGTTSKLEKLCLICEKKILVWPYRIKEKRTCSRKCGMLLRWKEGKAKGFKNGHKINLGRKFPESFGLAMKQRHYKNKKVSYAAYHVWLPKAFGKPDHCDICNLNTSKKLPSGRNFYQWSNRTGIYSKDLQNWWMLCQPCHELYDHKFLT